MTPAPPTSARPSTTAARPRQRGRSLPTGAAALATVLLAGCQNLPGWMVWQHEAQITDYRHFDNAPIARAAAPWVLPVASATLNWPGGLSTAAAEDWVAAQETTALVVLRRGQVVYERYFNGHQRDSIGTSFSMAKSVVSSMVGVALADGRITSIDDPITRYLPELLRNDARFGAISLRHLLLMRSGIAFDEGYQSPFADAARFYLTSNMPDQVAGLRIAGAPGLAFSYQSGDTQLLAMALERATGQRLADYVQTRLWQPMGAEFDASWSLDSAASGVARGFCCLNARAIDFVRFGQLVLQEGARDGHSIIPADWLRLSTAAQTLDGLDDVARRNIEEPGGRHAAFYAWQWRRAPLPHTGRAPVPSQDLVPGPDFYAQGLLGQVIYIAPQSQTVVLRLGGGPGEGRWPRWLGTLARLNP